MIQKEYSLMHGIMLGKRLVLAKLDKVPVKKGLYHLLDYLKRNNCKMAIASSSPGWEVEKHLEDADIYDYFVGIVCGDMIQNSKPDPEIYLRVCELLEANPMECYALEDSKNGLLSAHRAGCKPIMVPDLWQPDDEILKVIVGVYNDLDEVKVALKKEMYKMI